MGNNQTRSTQENVRELSSTRQVNESGKWSLGFFRNKAFAALLLTSLYAFVQSSCSKSSELEEELIPKNRSKGGCNDVMCTLKFERDYVIAERTNESSDDAVIAMHLLLNGASANEVTYIHDDLCLTNGAGDLPMPHSRSVLPIGETYRDTFYYDCLAIDGTFLQPGDKVTLVARVQPMHPSTSGLDLCKNDGNIAIVPGE